MAGKSNRIRATVMTDEDMTYCNAPMCSETFEKAIPKSCPFW